MKEFNYARQSHAPDWYDRLNPLHVAATSGTSPSNEWYGFQNEQDAHDLACSFKSQSFIDEFVLVGEGSTAKFYHVDDVTDDGDEHGLVNPVPLRSWISGKMTTPACLQSMVDAESAF